MNQGERQQTNRQEIKIKNFLLHCLGWMLTWQTQFGKIKDCVSPNNWTVDGHFCVKSAMIVLMEMNSWMDSFSLCSAQILQSNYPLFCTRTTTDTCQSFFSSVVWWWLFFMLCTDWFCSHLVFPETRHVREQAYLFPVFWLFEMSKHSQFLLITSSCSKTVERRYWPWHNVLQEL